MNEQLYKLLQKAREDAELRKRIWAEGSEGPCLGAV